MVVELVDGDDVTAVCSRTAILFESGLKLSQGEGVRFASKHAAAEVAGAQFGAQQILAREAGVERQLQVVVERGGVGQRYGCPWTTREFIRCPIECVGSRVDRRSREGIGSHHEGGQATELGGGGELGGLQLTHLGFEAIDTTAQPSQFYLELLDQLLEFIGHLSDAVEAGIQQGGSLIAGQRLAAFEAAIGVAGDAAVALDQVGQGLKSPVARPDIGELGDAGDLLLAGVSVHTCHVEVGGVGSQRSRQTENDEGGTQRKHGTESPGHRRAGGLLAIITHVSTKPRVLETMVLVWTPRPFSSIMLRTVPVGHSLEATRKVRWGSASS